jgi:hypothetical protein
VGPCTCWTLRSSEISIAPTENCNQGVQPVARRYRSMLDREQMDKYKKMRGSCVTNRRIKRQLTTEEETKPEKLTVTSVIDDDQNDDDDLKCWNGRMC